MSDERKRELAAIDRMLTRYYEARESADNIVVEINDAYLEAFVTLEVVEAENARLRELCHDLMDWVSWTTLGESVPVEEYAMLVARMCELGMEERV